MKVRKEIAEIRRKKKERKKLWFIPNKIGTKKKEGKL